MCGFEVVGLVFGEGVEGVGVVIILSLGANFGIDHAVEVIFVLGLFGLLLKQGLISCIQVTPLLHFLVDIILDQGDLHMLCQLILLLQYIKQGPQTEPLREFGFEQLIWIITKTILTILISLSLK